eukprot:SAG31_NODE_530_length_14420_cov_4.259968_10_plen_524_part_00
MRRAEIGNGAFQAELSSMHLAQAQTHMTLWCIMKVVLLLGNDLSQMSNATLQVVKNPLAIAISQDVLGIAGQRVASVPPGNLTLVDSGDDALAILAPCNATKRTQLWRYTPRPDAPTVPELLRMAPCNQSDRLQRFVLNSGPGWTPLLSSATGQCVDASRSYGAGHTSGFMRTGFCNRSNPAQSFKFDVASAQISTANATLCIKAGPDVTRDVVTTSCDSAGSAALSWQKLPTGQLRTTAMCWRGSPPGATPCDSPAGAQPLCMAVSRGLLQGTLSTEDALGREWLLLSSDWNAPATMQTQGPQRGQFIPRFGASNVALAGSARANATPYVNTGKLWAVEALADGTEAVAIGESSLFPFYAVPLNFLDEFGASGPLPHTRWLTAGGHAKHSWLFDARATVGGSAIRLASGSTVTDDDAVGGVKLAAGETFCVELSHAGNLETWHAPLASGRHAVAFVNRFPAPQQAFRLELEPSLGFDAHRMYTVQDVWEGTGHEPSPVRGQLNAVVDHPHGSKLYVLTPVAA